MRLNMGMAGSQHGSSCSSACPKMTEGQDGRADQGIPDAQVCPEGAKVRLNMGITERRYRNWDAALGHYLRARELAGDGFCEPDYWIGVTRINQGDEVALGAEVRPR